MGARMMAITPKTVEAIRGLRVSNIWAGRGDKKTVRRPTGDGLMGETSRSTHWRREGTQHRRANGTPAKEKDVHAVSRLGGGETVEDAKLTVLAARQDAAWKRYTSIK